MNKAKKIPNTHAKVLKMVQLALLAAIEVVLMMIYIPINGTINLNFGLVPIVITGILFGPVEGCLMGIISGVVTMIQVLTGSSPLYLCLVAANPVVASLLCIVKTAVAGFLTGLVYRLLNKISKYKSLNVIIPAAVCPIVNTSIFALAMLTVFGNALMADPEISSWTTGGLFSLVFLVLIGINFIVELPLNVVVCPVLSKVLFTIKRG